MREKLYTFILLVGTIAGIVAVIIAYGWLNTLSRDALAIGLGMVGGCAVGLVPIAVVLAVAWFAIRYRETRARQQPVQQPPPVVVVAGGQTMPVWTPQYPHALQTSSPREFTVIGEN